MSEMVERVADAICKKSCIYQGSGSRCADRCSRNPNSFKSDFLRDKARAAIEAMREPTDEMLRAGASAFTVAPGPQSQRTANITFQFMLNAALKEGKGDGH